MKRTRPQRGLLIRLSLAEGAPLPNEFRIFTKGWNRSEHGEVLFDDAAAKMVMNHFAKHGVDRMIDLEHLSLDPEAKNFDPDARGWFKLELRDGELWAVSVSWTSDGTVRLNDKTQRFISPAFFTDKDKRVTKVVNVALTAMPATHEIAPLVAASEPYTNEEKAMTPEQFAKLAEALELGVDANVEDILAAIGAMMSKIKGGLAGEEPGKEKPKEGEAPPPPPNQSSTPAEGEAAKDEEKAVAARLILATTGKATLSEAIDEIGSWRTSHTKLEAEREKLSKDRAVLEDAERRQLGAKLVLCGIAPAMVWEDPKAKVLKLAAPYAGMTIVALRAHAAKGRPMNTGSEPPEGGDGDDDGELTERELKKCREQNIDPKKYRETKARVRVVNGGKA